VAEVDASLTLDPTQLEQRMSPRTRAIIVVHMRGAPSDMDAIMAIAQRHGIGVLEDVAQACGASYRGRRLGSIGDVGAFSFQFNKIMTAGEGGMVITSNPEIHQRVQMYQDVYGGRRNGIPADQILPGVNYRMGELPAAVALAQLHRLDQLLQDMRANRTAILAAVTPTLNAHNVAVRSLNDPSGDASIALVMLAPTAEQATWMAKALRAEGAGGFVLYRPDQVDYHVYTHWEPIVHQRSWSEPHNPWSWHGGPFDYSPQACPRSLDLLGRAVHLDISPDLGGTQIEEIAEAIVKVVQALPTA
jgi:8-amino-3,8-dideoxy-alpha-D-manno-octulosonate transaminase